MASITIISACVLCSVPQHALCLVQDTSAKELLDLTNSINTDDLEQKFDDLQQSIDESSGPLAEGKKFMNLFLEELRSRHGITLTLPQACQLVKANLHILQIPEETKEPLLTTIMLLSEETTEEILQENMYSANTHKNSKIGSTIQKGWDHLRGKTHKHKKNYDQQRRVASLDPNIELPGNVYVGGVEMFSGALVCLLPFPGAMQIGFAMIVDGGRRIIDSYVQANDEDRLRKPFPGTPGSNPYDFPDSSLR